MPNVTENGSLANSKIKRDGLSAGTAAPAFCLPGLYGGTFSLSDWKGKDVLLLFIDPECQPCSELAKDIQQQHSSGIATRIVAISRGDAQANLAKARDLELSFPILLQSKWEISKEYAIFATPVAYFIDRAGIIARDVAVGHAPIMSLLHKVRGGITSKIEARIEDLNRELIKGQQELQSIDQKRAYLIETMQRIVGARQVLAEFLNMDVGSP